MQAEALNNEIKKQVTSSWSLFIQLSVINSIVPKMAITSLGLSFHGRPLDPTINFLSFSFSGKFRSFP
jgi:hypothetical protein